MKPFSIINCANSESCPHVTKTTLLWCCSKRKTSPIACPSVQGKYFTAPVLLLGHILRNSASDLLKCRAHNFSEVSLFGCEHPNISLELGTKTYLILSVQCCHTCFVCSHNGLTSFDHVGTYITLQLVCKQEEQETSLK